MKNKSTDFKLTDPITSDLDYLACRYDPQFFFGKHILITGASGLIGSYLLAYFVLLSRRGYPVEVTALTHSELSGPLKELMSEGCFTHLQIDLSDYRQYNNLPRNDITIHAAGYAQPSLFMAKPASTLSINVAATLALLENVSADGTFLFLSSSEVYCGAGNLSCHEESCGISTPYHPRSSYIEGKRSGEAACAAYTAKGLRAISARLGDIYGPGTRPHDQRALNSFIEQAITTGQIKLRDQGASMRSYCYVTDAVETLLNILFYGRENVYNVSAPIFTSIRKLALTIGELSGAKVTFPAASQSVPGAPAALKLDLSRIGNEFSKLDYLNLEEGLKRTIRWQQYLYGKDVSNKE